MRAPWFCSHLKKRGFYNLKCKRFDGGVIRFLFFGGRTESQARNAVEL